MKDNLAPALKFILYYEKYISNIAGDPGGYTIFGICERDWPSYVTAMHNMSEDEARVYASKFYERNYWNKINGDQLPSLLDIVLLDCAVNQGISRALQISSCAWDWRDAIILRSDCYDDLSSFDRFGRGWEKRLVSLRDYIASNFTVLAWDTKELVKAAR